MKALTKKQRGKIYLNVAEKIFLWNENRQPFCCYLLMRGIGKDYFKHGFNEKLFPEFMLLKPINLTGLIWFNIYIDSAKNNNHRITAMILASELTKN
jgi:hypothetical protein